MPHRPKPRSQSRKSVDIAAPPGLELSIFDRVEKLEQASGVVDIVDIARRLQRIELLLFCFSEADFTKLDEHIKRVLADGCAAKSLEVEEVNRHVSLPATCEIYSLDDGVSTCDAESMEPCQSEMNTSIVASGSCMFPDNTHIISKLEQIDADMQRLMVSLDLTCSTSLQSISGVDQHEIDECAKSSDHCSLPTDDEEEEDCECEKCGENHPSNTCLYFKLPRNPHPDSNRNVEGKRQHKSTTE